MHFTACATMVWNVMDYPAGVVPITAVRGESDEYPANDVPRDFLEGQARSVYNAARMKGLPVGVQVVGLPWQEETVLRAMRVLGKAYPYVAPSFPLSDP